MRGIRSEIPGLAGVRAPGMVVLLAVVAAFTLQQMPTAQQGPSALEPPDPVAVGEWCATVGPDGASYRLARVLEGGELISFVQEPAILLANRGASLRLRDVIVQGDLERVVFDRWVPSQQTFVPETWTRTETRSVDGRLVSVFQPAWPADVVERALGESSRGFDYPYIYLGSFQGPVEGPARPVSVYLRAGSTAIPPAEVGRLDDTVQYASHVVNLVVPGFGDGRITTGDKSFELSNVTHKFYEHFEDSYQILAVVPQASHPDTFTAFHLYVQNQVDGIGLPRLDRAREYGSAGSLVGVELYAQTGPLSNRVVNHELSHTWGHHFDWRRIAGVIPKDSTAHTPLISAGETLIGAVLSPTLRVAVSGDGAKLERTPVYARQHPLELYAMGLLSPSQMPSLEVFEDQAQFTLVAATVGSPVAGSSKTVTINDIMGVHGPRSGPVPSTIDRATVVVSRDTLLSAEEMAYWNYFAARLEDPGRNGVMSWNGQPSFEFASSHQVDVRTDIRPKTAPQVRQSYPAEWPAFGATDCGGVVFESPLPARYRVGERIDLRGRVTATDRRDFSQMLVAFRRYSDIDDDRVLIYGDVSRSGQFSVQTDFQPDREGLYSLAFYLFWPDAPSQYPRCWLTPVAVQGRNPS